MANNELSNVVVSKHIASSNPILPIIKVVVVIEHGQGTLTETLQGGQVKITVNLAKGQEHDNADLTDGDVVYLHGDMNGAPFTLPTPLTTDRATEPWLFVATSGTTG